MPNNSWYVITGGPSSGKTTLLAELEKLGHHTVPEAARWVIDRGRAKGLTVAQIRRDEKKFQDQVLRRKVVVETKLDPAKTIFFDRGMHDSLAYYRYYNFTPDPQAMQAMQKSTYGKIFLLEPLPVFERDYSRTESDDFPLRIHKLLHNAYAEYGMQPILVPPLDLKKRTQIILQNLVI